MRAVFFHGSGEITVGEQPAPEIELPGDAIVRVTLSGISGADVAAYAGRLARHPGPIGCELVGVVEAVGPSVTRLKAGQRVVSPPATFCGGCFYCKQGLLSACGHRHVYGIDLMGAQAEYVRVPNADAVLEPLADGLSDEQAVFLAELLPAAVWSFEAAGVKAGDSVAVLGCGPTGLSAQLLARTAGAGQVFGVDHHDYRLEAATKLGATALDFERDDVAGRVRAVTDGRGADVVVEAVGKPEALRDAIELTRPYGTVISLGRLDATNDVAIDGLLAKQAQLIGAGAAPVKNYMGRVVKMMTRGVIDPRPLASHTLALDEAPRAYRMMADRSDGALKVLLRL
jgi:threonine dehydrogenase-like Zn-dependent dehydrogenase